MAESLTRGGVFRTAIEEAKGLRNSHRVTLISLMPSYDQWNELIGDLQVRFPFQPHLRWMPNEILAALASSVIRTPGAFDLIISHDLPASRNAYLTCKASRRTYVSYVHEPNHFTLRNPILGPIFKFSRKYARKFATRTLSKAELVLTNSRMNSRRIQEILGIESKPVYLGCHPASKPNTEGRTFALMVERLYPWDIFWRTLEIMRHVDGFQLVIAGSRTPQTPFLLHAIRKISKNHGLTRRVKIVVSPSESQLNSLYTNARVLIQPAVEPFGMPVLEAAGKGCCSIVAKGSGVCEIMGDEVFLEKEGDMSGFAARVQKLMTDEKLAAEMGARAWNKAKQFSWDRHVQTIEDIALSLH